MLIVQTLGLYICPSGREARHDDKIREPFVRELWRNIAITLLVRSYRPLLRCKAKGLKDLPDDGIAVIGMATQVPGAEDIGEVWEVLTAGKPQHREVPKEQFEMETVWQEADPNRNGHGNFIDAYAKNLVDFFEEHSIRMSCGGLILDTAKSRKYSATFE
ncbi:hypothetical protein ZTR_00908 [Talaromyces verruculosus]|nr:hypothetical protein ZTR_00908 [Talaromyces verruculosus]